MPVQASSLHNESEAYIWWKVGFLKQTKTKRMSVLGLPDSYEDVGSFTRHSKGNLRNCGSQDAAQRIFAVMQ